MSRRLIVQKYGGTSVGTIERIRKVAERIARTKREGVDVMVVVSAMAGETDKLLNMARQISESPNRREIDLLLSSGERISSALVTIALNAIGCPAVSLTGRQMGLLTDNTHTRARIKQIDGARARKFLQENHVVVVAGFQGINERGDVTTLGRGGSDTSAVALAVALNADSCEIYTDVDGVYTSDPNVVPDARKLDVVSYEEMMEMASLGAKVLQIRSVEFAKNFNMPLVVRSSYNDEPGTLICKEDSKMEQPVVSGVMYDKKQTKITVSGVPDQPGVAARIFGALAAAELSVDMIIQNVSAENHTDISFTLAAADAGEAAEIMRKVAPDLRATGVSCNSEIAKISIVGAGMRSHSGVAARMFNGLSRENINIMMISTSEIRISCVIEKKYAELATRVLHEEFGLSREAVRSDAKSRPVKSKPQPRRKAAGS
ncbi:MAG: aspartate kinase [Nitrospinae bacterium]|nr:aspartate kinase [Nitrospinota bacterium]